MSERLFHRLLPIALLPLLSSAAMALGSAPVLPVDVAKQMVVVCETQAKAKGLKMNISVVDAGANQIVFEGMDGAPLGSSRIAQMKAQSAAWFPMPTRTIQELAYGKDLKGGSILGIALMPGLMATPGGLPITTANGVPVGAIGVSGAFRMRTKNALRPGLMPSRTSSRPGAEISTGAAVNGGRAPSGRRSSRSA
jgi:glc operon protein GlcG